MAIIITRQIITIGIGAEEEGASTAAAGVADVVGVADLILTLGAIPEVVPVGGVTTTIMLNKITPPAQRPLTPCSNQFPPISLLQFHQAGQFYLVFPHQAKLAQLFLLTKLLFLQLKPRIALTFLHHLT